MGSPKRERFIDLHTYGGSKAGENLADILNKEYPRLHRKVGCFYCKFASMMTGMLYSWKHFQGHGGLLELMKLYRTQQLERVRKSNLPEIVKSHLANVMTVTYRQTLLVVKNLLKRQ